MVTARSSGVHVQHEMGGLTMARARAVKANHGEKTIKVTLNFWTDNFAVKGKVVPKHAWDSGLLYVAANKTHGIPTQRSVRFSSLSDVGESVRKALREAGVRLSRAHTQNLPATQIRSLSRRAAHAPVRPCRTLTVKRPFFRSLPRPERTCLQAATVQAYPLHPPALGGTSTSSWKALRPAKVAKLEFSSPKLIQDSGSRSIPLHGGRDD